MSSMATLLLQHYPNMRFLFSSRYPRIDYQYKFCDKTKLKASFSKRCHHLANNKSKTPHRHHHHHYKPNAVHSNSLADQRSRTLFNRPFASFEHSTGGGHERAEHDHQENHHHHQHSEDSTSPPPPRESNGDDQEEGVDFVTA